MWKTTTYETTKLTLELRDIVDNGEHSVDIWDFDYPSYYKNEEKKLFEKKVIDHYYFRQIGQETVGRFLHYFRSKIREIMPYYIEMYKTAEIMSNLDDPFGNVDITETFEQTSTSSSTTTGSRSVESTSTSGDTISRSSIEDKDHRFSDTPQGTISNVLSHISEGAVDKNQLTEDATTNTVTSGNSTGTDSSTNEGNDTVSHTYTKKGNQGVNTYAHDMIEFRQTILNIDMMIINDLNELFLGVY